MGKAVRNKDVPQEVLDAFGQGKEPDNSNVPDDVLNAFGQSPKKKVEDITGGLTGLLLEASKSPSPSPSLKKEPTGNEKPYEQPFIGVPTHINQMLTFDMSEREEFQNMYGFALPEDKKALLVNHIVESRKDPAAMYERGKNFVLSDINQHPEVMAGVPYPEKLKEQILEGDGNINIQRYYSERAKQIDKERDDLLEKIDPLLGDPVYRSAEASRQLKDYQKRIEKLDEYKTTLLKYSDVLNQKQADKFTPLPEKTDTKTLSNYFQSIGRKTLALHDPIEMENQERDIATGQISKLDKEIIDKNGFQNEITGLNAKQSSLNIDLKNGKIKPEDYGKQTELITNQFKSLLTNHPGVKPVLVRDAIGQIIERNRSVKNATMDAAGPGLGAIKSVWENIISSIPWEGELKEAITEIKKNGYSLTPAEEQELLNNPAQIPLTSSVGRFVNATAATLGKNLSSLFLNDADTKNVGYRIDRLYQASPGQQSVQPQEIVDTKATIKDAEGKDVPNPNYMQRVPNPAAGERNWIVGSINQASEVAGTVVLWSQLGGGIGGAAGKILGGVGGDVVGYKNALTGIKEITKLTAAQKNIIGTLGASSILTYHENKEAAREFTSDPAAQNAFATLRTIETALAFTALNPGSIVNKILGKTSPEAVKSFVDIIPKEGIKAMKPETVTKYLKETFKSALGANASATAIIEADHIAGLTTKLLFNPAANKDVDIMGDIKNIALDNLISFAPLSLLEGRAMASHSKARREAVRQSMYEAADNVPRFQDHITEAVKDNRLTLDEANKKLKIISQLNAIKNSKDIPKNFSAEDKAQYSFSMLQEVRLNDELKGMTDKVQVERKKAEIDKLQAERQQILDKPIYKNEERISEEIDKGNVSGNDQGAGRSEPVTEKEATQEEKKPEEIVPGFDLLPDHLREHLKEAPTESTPAEQQEDIKPALFNQVREAAAEIKDPIFKAAFENANDASVEASLSKVAEDLGSPNEATAIAARTLYGDKISDIALQLFPKKEAEIKPAQAEAPAPELPVEENGPAPEKVYDDVEKGNLLSFKYADEAQVPEGLKDKISSVTNESGVTVTMSQAEADHYLGGGFSNDKLSGVIELPVKKLQVDPRIKKGRADIKQTKHFVDNPSTEPVIVYKHPNGTTYVLDGRSRVQAARRNKTETLPAKYFRGTVEEALKFAADSRNKTASDYAAEQRVEKQKRIEAVLANEPSSFKETVLQDFLRGAKLLRADFERYAGFGGKVTNPLRLDFGKTKGWRETRKLLFQGFLSTVKDERNNPQKLIRADQYAAEYISGKVEGGGGSRDMVEGKEESELIDDMVHILLDYGSRDEMLREAERLQGKEVAKELGSNDGLEVFLTDDEIMTVNDNQLHDLIAMDETEMRNNMGLTDPEIQHLENVINRFAKPNVEFDIQGVFDEIFNPPAQANNFTDVPNTLKDKILTYVKDRVEGFAKDAPDADIKGADSKENNQGLPAEGNAIAEDTGLHKAVEAEDPIDELPFQHDSNQPAEKTFVADVADKLLNGFKNVISGLRVVHEDYQTEIDVAVENGRLTEAQAKLAREANGFYNAKDKTIYLNPDKAKIDTPVHEFAHIWEGLLRTTNRQLHNRGINLIKGTKYESDIASNKKYEGLSRTEKLREALVQAIGERGAKIVTAEGKKTFRDWVKELYNNVASYFGGKTEKGIDDLTLNDFLDLAAKDVLKGGELVDRGALIKRAQEIANTEGAITQPAIAQVLQDAANRDISRFETYLSNIADQAHDPASATVNEQMNGKELVEIAKKLFPEPSFQHNNDEAKKDFQHYKDIIDSVRDAKEKGIEYDQFISFSGLDITDPKTKANVDKAFSLSPDQLTHLSNVLEKTISSADPLRKSYTENFAQPKVEVPAENTAAPEASPAEETPAAEAPTEEPAAEETPAPKIGDFKIEDGKVVPITEADLTGIRNSMVDEKREQRGLEPFEKPVSRGWDEIVIAEAKDAIDSGSIDPDVFAQNLVSNPRPITDTEQVILALNYTRLSNDHKYISDAIRDAQKANDKVALDVLLPQRSFIEDAMNTNELASRGSGGEMVARSLAARNLVLKDDYSRARQIQLIRNEQGGAITEEQRLFVENKVDEFQKRIDDLEKHLEKKSEENSKLAAELVIKNAQREFEKEKLSKKIVTKKEKLKTERDDIIASIRQKLKDQRNRLNSNPIPVEILPDIARLTKNLVMEGVTSLEAIVGRIHIDLKNDIEGLTERHVLDAISGYGIERPKQTKSEITDQINDIKAQAKLLSKLEDLEKGDTPAKQAKRGGKPSPEVTELRKKVAEAMKKNGISPGLAENKTPLENYKALLKRRLAANEEKIKTGDFEPKTNKKADFKIDEEAMHLKAKVEETKKQLDQYRLRLRMDNRGKFEKGIDYFVKWRRFAILSHFTTLGKLTAAAAQRVVTQPLEEMVGAVMQKVVPSLASEAPREGGFNSKAEAKAITEYLKAQLDVFKGAANLVVGKRVGEFGQILKTGRSELDNLYSKHEAYEPTWLDFFGNLHGALKNPVKRAEFFRSFEKRMAYAQRQGFDILDPTIQETIGADAYIDANRSIFMQDNWLTKEYEKLINNFRAKGAGGQLVAGGLRFLLPIVKVPTNYVNESLSYAVGVVKAGYVLRNGVQNLDPYQHDYVMRALKKNAIGLVMLSIGYFNPQSIGGYYSGKRKDKDLAAGDINVLGVDLPHWMLHSPLVEMLQFGATIRRTEEMDKKKKAKNGGVIHGVTEATTGLLGQIPFFDTPKRVSEAFKSERAADYFLGSQAKSIIVPGGVEDIAKLTDPEEKRKLESVGDHLKSAIPGLREELKVKKK